MLEATVRVVNHLGLHARAAGQLVKLARRFKSSITLRKPDGSAEADARSMLSVLTLAASINSRLIVEIEGDDEAEAMDAMKELFESGFGET
jgi:phosphotransferase system HPr (HPr) family protein